MRNDPAGKTCADSNTVFAAVRIRACRDTDAIGLRHRHGGRSDLSRFGVVWRWALWVAYTNGAASDGTSGSSTVVLYNTVGGVLNTWTIQGNVDGLKSIRPPAWSTGLPTGPAT